MPLIFRRITVLLFLCVPASLAHAAENRQLLKSYPTEHRQYLAKRAIVSTQLAVCQQRYALASMVQIPAPQLFPPLTNGGNGIVQATSVIQMYEVWKLWLSATMSSDCVLWKLEGKTGTAYLAANPQTGYIWEDPQPPPK